MTEPTDPIPALLTESSKQQKTVLRASDLVPSDRRLGSTASSNTPKCPKCKDTGAYVVREPAETSPDGLMVIGPSSSTTPCDCRNALAPRAGDATWWATERVYAVDVTVPIFHEIVRIGVDAEVPMSRDNFRVYRRGNRYCPALIEIDAPKAMTLHSDTARTLARALVSAAEAADTIDDECVDTCGHWWPCDCQKQPHAADAVDPVRARSGDPSPCEKEPL